MIAAVSTEASSCAGRRLREDASGSGRSGSEPHPRRPDTRRGVVGRWYRESPERPRSGSAQWEIGINESPWHRYVSPIFFLLLVVAGLMLGFIAFFLLPEVAHAVAG